MPQKGDQIVLQRLCRAGMEQFIEDRCIIKSESFIRSSLVHVDYDQWRERWNHAEEYDAASFDAAFLAACHFASREWMESGRYYLYVGVCLRRDAGTIPPRPHPLVQPPPAARKCARAECENRFYMTKHRPRKKYCCLECYRIDKKPIRPCLVCQNDTGAEGRTLCSDVCRAVYRATHPPLPPSPHPRKKRGRKPIDPAVYTLHARAMEVGTFEAGMEIGISKAAVNGRMHKAGLSTQGAPRRKRQTLAERWASDGDDIFTVMTPDKKPAI